MFPVKLRSGPERYRIGFRQLLSSEYSRGARNRLEGNAVLDCGGGREGPVGPAPLGEVRRTIQGACSRCRLLQPSSLQANPLPVADNDPAVFDDVHHGIDPEMVNQIGIIGGVAEHQVHLFTDL